MKMRSPVALPLCQQSHQIVLCKAFPPHSLGLTGLKRKWLLMHKRKTRYPIAKANDTNRDHMAIKSQDVAGHLSRLFCLIYRRIKSRPSCCPDAFFCTAVNRPSKSVLPVVSYALQPIWVMSIER